MRRSLRTSLVDHWFVLNVLGPDCKTNVTYQRYDGIYHMYNSTHFSVFRVSCRNFTPGARLQIRRPTELPPRASCRRRVNLEFRYGIRLWKVHEYDPCTIKLNKKFTAPWFSACTTWPSTLKDLLIAADSAILDGSLPVICQLNGQYM